MGVGEQVVDKYTEMVCHLHLAARGIDQLSQARGLVYFIKGTCQCSGLVKIGLTRNLAARLSALVREYACRLDVFHIIVTDNPLAVERFFHCLFFDKRADIDGHYEWFKLTGDDLALVCQFEAIDSVSLELAEIEAERQMMRDMMDEMLAWLGS